MTTTRNSPDQGIANKCSYEKPKESHDYNEPPYSRTQMTTSRNSSDHSIPNKCPHQDMVAQQTRLDIKRHTTGNGSQMNGNSPCSARMSSTIFATYN